MINSINRFYLNISYLFSKIYLHFTQTHNPTLNQKLK